MSGRSGATTPWEKADLFFLEDSLQRGMSSAEIAGFLGRTADEVREKAKKLERVSQPQPRRGPRLVWSPVAPFSSARLALFIAGQGHQSARRAVSGGFSAPLVFCVDGNEPDRVNGEIDSNYGSFLAHHNSGLVG